MTRTEEILSWREARKMRKEQPQNCIFHITTPRCTEEEHITNNVYIKIVTDLFDKYKIKWMWCDTVDGTFNLNRDWIYTEDAIPCYVEYSGVYPVNWEPKDVAVLEKLDREGTIIIRVDWVTDDGKYIPNH